MIKTQNTPRAASAALALMAAGLIAGSPETACAEAGDILVRVRALAAVPFEGGSDISIGGEADIDVGYSPEVDFTYFITDNIGVELIAASTPHDVGATGTALGDLDLGSVRLLPPTLTAQWHFFPEETVRPYVGAGINYTWFFEENFPGGEDIDYEDSFGWVLQAGVDVDITETVFLNLDIKKVFLDTDVFINAGAGVTANAEVNIDPLLLGVGFGVRF
ncbi:MAG: OmpW family protein [Alphaproteobacteria bacterium]